MLLYTPLPIFFFIERNVGGALIFMIVPKFLLLFEAVFSISLLIDFSIFSAVFSFYSIAKICLEISTQLILSGNFLQNLHKSS